MTLAVYDWVECTSTQLAEEPRVKSTQFGDGYIQRTPDGLNPIRQKWSLVHTNCDDSQADAIVAFLEANYLAYSWTPLWHTTAITVQALRWQRSRGVDSAGYACSTVTVEVEQRFDTA